MAIDSSLFIKDLAAREYQAGEEIEIPIHTGPQVVRDGYGQPKLENIRTGMMSTGATAFVPGYFIVKNSNWVDPVINEANALVGATALSNMSANYQFGQAVPLQVNSSWSVVFHVTATVTTTAKNSLAVLINIDYPSVSAVRNPMIEQGIPCSNVVDVPAKQANTGDYEAAAWSNKTVDILKAGHRYLMAKVGCYSGNPLTADIKGFVRISGAASQSGLTRIIPVTGDANAAMKAELGSSETFVKGPMTVSVLVNNSAPFLVIDWVKR